jgi:hypothetical protein
MVLAWILQGLLWYEGTHLRVEGQGWPETSAEYTRLPSKAKETVRGPVWDLSQQSAGLFVSFATDASSVHVRWKLTAEGLSWRHMPATGVSGVDLYVHHEGRWRWLACGQPDGDQNEKVLVEGLPAQHREYRLYLPLYNGVSTVKIGVPKGSTIAPGPEVGRKPLVFYGTSITQGACASRPGMAHVAQLGRRLDYPTVNLGFSGNGKMEAEVVELLAEVPASLYIIDCLPNLRAPEVRERTEPLVRRLRRSHPRTPILLVEDRNYADAFLVAAKNDRNLQSQAALFQAFQALQ